MLSGEIDDFHPVRVLAHGQLLRCAQRPGGGVNRVHRHAVGFLPRCDQETAAGVDGETTRCFFGRCLAQWLQFAGGRIHAEGGQGAGRALRGVEVAPVRAQVDVCRPGFTGKARRQGRGALQGLQRAFGTVPGKTPGARRPARSAGTHNAGLCPRRYGAGLILAGWW